MDYLTAEEIAGRDRPGEVLMPEHVPTVGELQDSWDEGFSAGQREARQGLTEDHRRFYPYRLQHWRLNGAWVNGYYAGYRTTRPNASGDGQDLLRSRPGSDTPARGA